MNNAFLQIAFSSSVTKNVNKVQLNRATNTQEKMMTQGLLSEIKCIIQSSTETSRTLKQSHWLFLLLLFLSSSSFCLYLSYLNIIVNFSTQFLPFLTLPNIHRCLSIIVKVLPKTIRKHETFASSSLNKVPRKIGRVWPTGGNLRSVKLVHIRKFP